MYEWTGKDTHTPNEVHTHQMGPFLVLLVSASFAVVLGGMQDVLPTD